MLDHLSAVLQHAYYCGEIDAGRRAAERILATPDLPVETEQLARMNRPWYTPLIGDLVGVTHHRIDVEPVYDGWTAFNPTILMYAGGLVGIVRSSNYRIVDHQYVMPESDAGAIRTENILVRFDHDYRVVVQRHIVAPEYHTTGYPVHGLEDCRLWKSPTGVHVSATIRDAAPWTDGRCRIATADLDLRTATLSNLVVLDGITTQEHEKNWMPIEGRGGWLYAASHDGHVVTVESHPEVAGGWQMLRRSPAPPIASRFRGGSQLIPWRGGYLGLVHEVAYVGRQRVYEHRLAWFDDRLRLTRLSPWFAFREPRAIEFAAGLAVHGDRLVASYGVRDEEAWLCVITEDDCDAILQDVDRDGVRAAG
jgi:predicted GH43/DUF377 family glycosyl hydrolase